MSTIYSAVQWLGHLIHELLLGFLSFGSIAVLFASIIGVVIWIVREFAR
jgi:hypothetical protein